MGLLDILLRKTSGAPVDQSALKNIFDLINDKNVGGLEGLAGKFANSGLSDVVDSWVNTGKNKTVTPTQVNNALGNDMVSQLAGKLGITPKIAAGMLAKYLPLIVDKLTPDGKMQSSGKIDIQDVIGALLRKR